MDTTRYRHVRYHLASYSVFHVSVFGWCLKWKRVGKYLTLMMTRCNRCYSSEIVRQLAANQYRGLNTLVTLCNVASPHHAAVLSDHNWGIRYFRQLFFKHDNVVIIKTLFLRWLLCSTKASSKSNCAISVGIIPTSMLCTDNCRLQ